MLSLAEQFIPDEMRKLLHDFVCNYTQPYLLHVLGSVDEVNLLFNSKYLLRDFHAGVYFHNNYSFQESLKWISIKKSQEKMIKARKSFGNIK